MQPFLTVALCTPNPLKLTLAGLHDLHSPLGSWELWVVDNASIDGTGAWGWQRLDIDCRFVQESQLGVAHARNGKVQPC